MRTGRPAHHRTDDIIEDTWVGGGWIIQMDFLIFTLNVGDSKAASLTKYRIDSEYSIATFNIEGNMLRSPIPNPQSKNLFSP